MTLRQILLFVVLGTASVAALVLGAGEWQAPATHDGPSSAPTPPAEEERGEEISIPGGLEVSSTKNLFVEAPPEPIVFEDPDHPGYRIRIPYYVAWTFHAKSADPMANSTEGEEVGVLCKGVTLEMFREPRTHDEALALKKGDRRPVLVRIFKAKEARVHGRIASQLREKGGRSRVDADRNSLVHLTKDVFIDDISEGLEITGSRVKVWPKLGKATGTGQFEIEHEAFVITGTGMKIEKLDSGRTLIEIMENPKLRLVNELQAGSAAGDLFQVQEGEFREATIRSTGRALIRRDDSGPQEQLHIDMRGDVRMNQEGGRSLDADRLTVLALKQDAPDAPTEARSKGWRLRRLTADGNVNLKFLDETDPKAAKLFGATTDHLIHRVPTAGVPTTLMEGPTRITFEGDVPIDGGERKNGVVHAYARERVWIGPVSGFEPPPGIKVESLRRVILEQEASVKRFGATARNSEYDELEGDRIEVIFLTTEALALGPKKEAETPTAPVKKERGQVQALEFLATGNVRLGGSRVQGRMDSLRALDLYGTTPLLITKGERTWLRFSGIGENQRLLGANEETPAATADVPAPAIPGTPGVTAEKPTKPTWRLTRLQATGEVDVVTSLGGPSLGIPVHVMGDRIQYDALRGLAELDGGPGRSAQIHAEARGGQRNELHARHLSFDRNAAMVHAKGTVRAGLWTLKNGGRSSGLRDSFKSAPPKKATALEVRTDAPIQVHLIRKQGANGVQEGAEQRIDIAGPLSASLQSDDDTIDRLRANRLDVVLMLSSEPAARRRPARATPSTARAPTRPAPASNSSAPVRPAPEPELTKVSLEAREVTTTLVHGAADVFTATGKVLLRNDMGRVEAERLVYRARDKSADVTGSARELAHVHIQDKGGLPNHVTANHFAMHWGEDGLERITAAGSESRPVRATILDAGSGRSTTPGLQAAPRAPGELQRFKIRSHGRLVLEATTVTAYDVWITQQRSKDRGRSWTPPVHIYAQRMVVRGRGLLGGGEVPRSVDTLDAEQVDLGGKETYFTTVGKDGKAEIWGHTFHFDVPAELLTLQGLKDKPVRFTQGTKVDMYYRSAGWNLRTGLPVLEGHRAVLSGKR